MEFDSGRCMAKNKELCEMLIKARVDGWQIWCRAVPYLRHAWGGDSMVGVVVRKRCGGVAGRRMIKVDIFV